MHMDRFLVGIAMLFHKMHILQEHNDVKYSIYGDSAYGRGRLICARHLGDSLNERQILENKLFSSARECIE